MSTKRLRVRRLGFRLGNGGGSAHEREKGLKGGRKGRRKAETKGSWGFFPGLIVGSWRDDKC